VSRRHRVTLRWYSPLAVDECLRRVHEACDEERLRWLGYAGHAGSRPVIARFDGPRFTLFQRDVRLWIGWPRDTGLHLVMLSGRCDAVPSGTSVSGGLRIHRPSAALVLGALAMLVVWVGVVLAELADPLWLPLLYAAVLAGSAGTWWYWYSSRVRRERASLTRFLRELLSARDVPG
jgi:hypothetical protein